METVTYIMKKLALLLLVFVFVGTLSCKDTNKAKEDQEMELTIKKIDSLEREIEEINQRIEVISNEAEQTVEEIN